LPFSEAMNILICFNQSDFFSSLALWIEEFSAGLVVINMPPASRVKELQRMVGFS